MPGISLTKEDRKKFARQFAIEITRNEFKKMIEEMEQEFEKVIQELEQEDTDIERVAKKLRKSHH